MCWVSSEIVDFLTRRSGLPGMKTKASMTYWKSVEADADFSHAVTASNLKGQTLGNPYRWLTFAHIAE